MKKDQNQLTWLMVSLIAFNMVWEMWLITTPSRVFR